MAKVLDALERARQERLKRQPETGDVQVGEAPLPADEEPREERAPEPSGSGFRSVPLRTRRDSAPYHAGISELIVTAHDMQSPITEQVRQIRTNLEAVLADYRSRSIVISSPVSGDGKTLVAANLATVLADDPGQQILLVDADLRKCELHRLFGTPPAPGLAECLRDLCSLDEAIHATSLPNLKIMPAGRMPDKPTVLFGSDRMVTLLGELQRTYRWIIFDTPPLLPVTDALVLGRDCVGMIMVVRMGKTSRPLIERAQERLAEMRLPVLGCVLNEYDGKGRDDAYYHKYYKREDQGGFRS